MDILPSSNYPLPTQSSLQLQYVGKNLQDCLTPAAVIDRAIVKRNCNAMLDTCKALGVGFRAHVKSHKTLELSKLQVGEDGPANFVVSTLIEAENLLPFLLQCESRGRPCGFIYGVPIPQSAVLRLCKLASRLQPSAVNVLIDNLAAFDKLREQLNATPGVHIGIYLKIDTGYHRAGITTNSPNFKKLVNEIAKGGPGYALKGFYSHFGHSYAGSSSDEAAEGLLAELKELAIATQALPENSQEKMVLTVGATPTATAAQNMLLGIGPKTEEFKKLLESLTKTFTVEFHAGVYPLLDLQQVATHARPATIDSQEGFEPLSKSNIGLKMLVEVTSTYDEREKPEALVSAGSLAMGREPCKSYPGWGIVTADFRGGNEPLVYDEQGGKTGWTVGRISQEHGILTWEGPREKLEPMTIGQKLMIWPNHACVAGAGFGWYLIVDSESSHGPHKVADVWIRWRGW